MVWKAHCHKGVNSVQINLWFSVIPIIVFMELDIFILKFI